MFAIVCKNTENEYVRHNITTSWNKNYETTVALLPFSWGQYGVNRYQSDLNSGVKMFLDWFDFKSLPSDTDIFLLLIY